MRHQLGGIAIDRLLDLSASRALVTGAGGGIGGQIAARLVEAGAAVALHSRATGAGAERAVELGNVLRAKGGTAITITADLGDSAGTEALVETAAEQLGGLDILINNAGDNAIGQDPPTWAQLRTINIDAVVTLSRCFGDVLSVTSDRVEGQAGAIVNIASIEGHQPAPGRADYATTKAAVLMLTRALAVELSPLGVRVNSVSPGLIHREGLEESWPDGVGRWEEAAPLARLGRGSDIANACLFLVSPMASWITGTDLVVDGGVLACQTW